MILNIFKRAVLDCRHRLPDKNLRFYGIYDPPYLQKKYEIPPYPVLNIQITGYTYPVLEKYQSFIHKLANILNITIVDEFPFPHREFKIKRFKTGGIVVDSTYDLKIYERDIQVSDVTATNCPIFIRLMEASLPEGVSLCIDKYDPIIQQKRRIPQKQLLDLKSELEELVGHKE